MGRDVRAVRRSKSIVLPMVFVPAVLVIARMLQGLSVGGEYGASATYLSEMALRNRRAFWASFQYFTLIGGQLLALAVVVLLQSTMPEAELQGWGWRVAFGIGALLAVLTSGEAVTLRLAAAGALMGLGVWLHLTERHEHEHEHEPIEHEHPHVHDEHHRHLHGSADPPGEPHTHRHSHTRLVHRHPHYPDLHHRHGHP